jgi:endo-1,4-beta-xylanase
MNRRHALKAFGAAALATALPARAVPTADSLDAIARGKGLRVGNAMGYGGSGVRKSPFRDAGYRALMARECSVIVAENECKWQANEPRPGEFRFAQADEMFAWAKQEGMAIRGHTLVWQTPKWLPKWVNEHDFGAQPVKEAERLLAARIATTCKHFGRDIHSWDVVNEAIDPATGEQRANVLNQRLGKVEQVDLCFRLAKEHAPHAQLVYNDYMRWDARSAKHRAGVLKLLHDLKARGTPVDALGLQSHIGFWDDNEPNGEAGPGEWRRFLDEVSAMGLRLLITEFDVSDKGMPTDVATRDAQVASIAKDYLDVTLSYPRLDEFMFWGMANNMSWLQEWIPRDDKTPVRGCPYDASYEPTPLRAAIAAAFWSMPPRA